MIITIKSDSQSDLFIQKSLNSKVPTMHPKTFHMNKLGPAVTNRITPMNLAIFIKRHASVTTSKGSENQTNDIVTHMPIDHISV